MKTHGLKSTRIAVTVLIAFSALATQPVAAQNAGGPPNAARSQTSPAAAPPSRPRNDAQIVRDVRRAFTRTPGLNSASITVRSRHAFVTLTGRVPQQSQIQRAGNAARSVRGVRGVSNHLTVHVRGGRRL